MGFGDRLLRAMFGEVDRGVDGASSGGTGGKASSTPLDLYEVVGLPARELSDCILD